MSTLILTHDDASGQALRQRIEVSGFTFYADTSVENGGSGSAPDPHELFDSSLAACKTLTLMLYAKRKSWPLEKVDVTLTRDASEERNGVYRLGVVLTLHGDLDAAQRAQLLAIADRCPVHKLMTAVKIEITTELSA